MAVTVTSVTLRCAAVGNGGGRINFFDSDITFQNGDTEVTQAAILAKVDGGSTGKILGICDYGGIAFNANVGSDGCSPYYDTDASAIRFVNSVTGAKNTAIEAAANAHFTIIVAQ